MKPVISVMLHLQVGKIKSSPLLRPYFDDFFLCRLYYLLNLFRPRQHTQAYIFSFTTHS